MKKNKNIALISQLFWQLLPSQIFCSMVAALSTLINGLIIGNSLDSYSIAALGLVGILSAIIATLSNLISGGARIVCGKHIGRGEFDKVNSAFTASLIMLVSMGTIILFAYLVFAPSIATLLGATGQIIETTALYIRANALGLLPLMISPCLMSFLDMNNQSKYSLLCAFILACCNLIFGLININVINGGLFGMGIASSLAQIVCLLCLTMRFIKDKSLSRICFKGLELVDFKEIVSLGLPSALVGLYQARNIVLNRYASSIGGADALTALSILNTCGGIFDSISIGLSSTITMLSSVFFGEQDRNSLIEFYKYAIKNSIIICFIKGLVMTVFAKQIAILFGAKGAIVGYATGLLIFYGITMPFNSFPNGTLYCYAATGKNKLVNTLLPFTCFVFPICSMIVLIPLLGINAVWSSYLNAEILMTITLFIISMIKNKSFPKNVESLLMIDKGFGVDKDNRMNITITNVEEVVNVSQQVCDFAKAKGADDRRAKMIGLCLEEMAANVVLHGFTKGKKNRKYYVDVYVRYENGKFYTRLRDNAPAFNPQRRLEKDKDDPTKNIGIKMVNKIAEEMNYQTTFGMNVLTIKI